MTQFSSQAKHQTHSPSGFLTTRWSVIERAGEVESEQTQLALSELCEIYWYPVYAFIRRRGESADAALDLTQGFFARLLDKRDLFQADSERGRFRAYLLGAVKNYLSNQRARDGSQRRGGGVEFLSLDLEESEARYQSEPETGETAEQVFDRSWARALLSSVMGNLRIEYEGAGKLATFQDLRGCLMSDGSLAPYRAIAERRGTSEGAIKVAVYRLRRRFGELLRSSIAETLRDPGEVEAELRGLFRALESR